MALTYEQKLERSRARYQQMKSERPEEYKALRSSKLEGIRRHNLLISNDPVRRAANAERMRKYRAFKAAQKLSLGYGTAESGATQDVINTIEQQH
jgi:hypothetical protein